MDYTQQPLIFKLQKVLRYIRLYGPARTWMKVRGQYHMNRNFATLPQVPERKSTLQNAGIIGCGNFAYSNIAYYLTQSRGPVIKGCMDTNIARAASLCQAFGGAYYTDDENRILNDPDIKLIYIASNHASHAEYAIKGLQAGKSVHIEKPHVVSESQLVRLCNAMSASTGTVGLGFNRPLSKFGRQLEQAIRSEHGPMVMNWFVAGHELPEDHWYFREDEGGRVLGNLCHWTDFMLRMVPPGKRHPIRIVPTRSGQSDCNIAVTYIFADGSIGAITFSAMGHTFEGVRERFAVHCGNLMASLDDFQVMVIERVQRKRRTRSLFRDHGHAEAILGSYNAVFGLPNAVNQYDVAYVWETAELFLKTKQALDNNVAVVVDAFSPARMAEPAARPGAHPRP